MTKKKDRPQSRTETIKAPTEGGVPASGINEAPASERPQYKGARKPLGETDRGFSYLNSPPENVQDQREYRPSSANTPRRGIH